jgi:hypothetical protein
MKKANASPVPQEDGILHVKTPFVPALVALKEQAGVTREYAVNQALRDFLTAFVPANYPKVKFSKEIEALLE